MDKNYKAPPCNEIDGLRISTVFPVEKVREAMQYEHQPNDLFLVTFPKCGTNWTRQIIYLIVNKGEIPDCNPFAAKDWTFLEMGGLRAVANMKKPGVIVTHLPPEKMQFSPHAKYICITRNPKDCCVSFYYHYKDMPQCQFEDSTFDDFFEGFVRGENPYGDYFDYLLTWYARRNEPNVLFLTYEDMKFNPKDNIIKLARFLGEDYGRMLEEDEEILEKIITRSSVSYMRGKIPETVKNLKQKFAEGHEVPEHMKPWLNDTEVTSGQSSTPAGPGFDIVRKGEVGDWKNHFSAEQSERMSKRITEKTRGSDVMDLFKEYI